jgi:hypothetical protein
MPSVANTAVVGINLSGVLLIPSLTYMVLLSKYNQTADRVLLPHLGAHSVVISR